MKRDKKTFQLALPPAVAEFEATLTRRQKELSEFAARFTACFLSTVGGAAAVDPFFVEQVLQELPVGIDVEKIQGLRAWIALEKPRVAAQFEQQLREFTNARGVALDGRYPSYFVADFVSIELRPLAGEGTVDGKKVRSLMFEAAMPLLIGALEADAKRSFSAESFLIQLLDACRRAAGVDPSFGIDQVPIKAAFRELIFVRQEAAFFKNPVRNNFVEYSFPDFARDLSRSIASGKLITPDGYRLNPGPTSTGDGIAIRFEGAARNLGRIGFVQGDR